MRPAEAGRTLVGSFRPESHAMLLALFRTAAGDPPRVGIVDEAAGTLAALADGGMRPTLAQILDAPDPAAAAKERAGKETFALADVTLLPPVESQEVWAAGVTYKRSQLARMAESTEKGTAAAADHYDRVYTADRPELFFKCVPGRVVAPGDPVRVRSDSEWTVPEPELALMVTPTGRIAGYTVGNDVSARDIEGENPLYLPQAKTYDGSCALGPWVRVADDPLDPAATTIDLRIERDGSEAFRGSTDLSQMARGLGDLVGWLTRDYTIGGGAVLLTGTGVIPPDDFTLEDGDVVSITIAGVGTLTNPVVRNG